MDNKNKEKKGILALEQLIQILIAIIGIILVIIIFTKVSSCGDTRELQAKGTLDKMVQVISSLKEAEPQSMMLVSPANWNIVCIDESHNENGAFKKPSTLFGKNVLCVCKDSECKFCLQTTFPIKKGDQLINLKIQTGNLTFVKMIDQINVTFKLPNETTK